MGFGCTAGGFGGVPERRAGCGVDLKSPPGGRWGWGGCLFARFCFALLLFGGGGEVGKSPSRVGVPAMGVPSSPLPVAVPFPPPPGPPPIPSHSPPRTPPSHPTAPPEALPHRSIRTTPKSALFLSWGGHWVPPWRAVAHVVTVAVTLSLWGGVWICALPPLGCETLGAVCPIPLRTPPPPLPWDPPPTLLIPLGSGGAECPSFPAVFVWGRQHYGDMGGGGEGGNGTSADRFGEDSVF